MKLTWIGVMISVLMGLPGVSVNAQSGAIAQLIQKSGNGVYVKQGNGGYRPVQQGSPLFRGDLLRVSEGSTAVIRCKSNSSTWTVPDDGVPWGVSNVCS